MKKSLSILLALLFVLCAMPVCAAENGGSFGAYEHVFIIGVDGAGAAFSQVESPCFDHIFGDFAYRHDAKTETVTISAQNWGSILTGVDCATHGFTNGGLEAAERDSSTGVNTIFYDVRKNLPQAELVSFNNWDAINHGLIETDLGVTKINRSSDAQVVDAIEAYLSDGNAPALMFVQLDSVDHAAHTWGGFSDEYYASVREIDRQVGRIYNAVTKSGLMENGLFILVADHGETADGHGGDTPEEHAAVLAAVGKTVNRTAMNENVHNRDVAAIALYALGIAQPDYFISTVPPELFGTETRALPGTVEIGPSVVIEEPQPQPTLWQRILDWLRNIFAVLFGWLC